MLAKSKSVYFYIINRDPFGSLYKANHERGKKEQQDQKLQNFIKNRLRHFGYKNYSFIDSTTEIKSSNSQYSCIIENTSPLFDTKLIDSLLQILDRNQQFDAASPKGALPGTDVFLLFRTSSLNESSIDNFTKITLEFDSQEKFNNNFNLKKLKRVKAFLNLSDSIAEMEKMTVEEFVKVLHQENVFEALAKSFEEVELIYLENCSYCQGKLIPLATNVSQPTPGYFPFDKPYHFRCERCNLVLLSPYVASLGTVKLYDKYYAEDQETTKYFLDRQSYFEHHETGVEMVIKYLPKEVSLLDIGTGSGHFLINVRKNHTDWKVCGSDLESRILDFDLDNKIKVKKINFLEDDLGKNAYELITAWEVIEHVCFEDFEILLEKIYKALRPGGIFLFSTPDFDSFLTRMFDFHVACPPYHPLVFSRSWLISYFSKNSKFNLLEIRSGSEVLSDKAFAGWFSYWHSNSRFFESRATAGFFLEMLKDNKMRDHLRDFIRKKNLGFELIGAIQKE